MKRIRLAHRGSDKAAVTLRGFFVLWEMLIVTVFFIGCTISRNEQADADPIIREPEKTEVHGEIGVMYGSNLGD